MKKTFHLPGRAVYAEEFKTIDDSVLILIDTGGMVADFKVQWMQLDAYVPQLQMFDDSWGALTACPELFVELARMNNKKTNMDQFCRVLRMLGFEDATPYTEEQLNNRRK